MDGLYNDGAHGDDDVTKGPWTPGQASAQARRYRGFAGWTGQLFTNDGVRCAEEDAVLRQLVMSQGPRNWTSIAACIPGRSGKSCRSEVSVLVEV